MKIAVVGATGPTGLEVIKEAIEQGMQVTALVRTPEKLKIENDNLTIQKANIFKEDEMAEHLKGFDAVVSCLGTNTGPFSTCTLYSDSAKSITNAMKTASVPKIICLVSWCTKSAPGNPKLVEWFMKPLFLRSVIADMARMEDYLSDNCQDLNYTVVRVPGLKDGASSGKEIKAVEGQHVPHTATFVPRRDIAKFMLSCTSSDTWDKKFVAIGI